MAERYQLPRSCVPPMKRRKDGGYPPSGGLEGGKTRCIREREDMVAFRKGPPPFLKATLPTCVPNRHGLSLLQHAPRPSPAARGLGPACHANRLRTEEAKPPRGVHTTAQRLQVTPPLLPRPTGERGGQPCRRHATAPSGRASPTPNAPAWRPRPTRHANGAPDAACKQPHRHLRHYRASSVAEPIPRLEATQRTTQQRQPDAAVNAAKSGPEVMTVAGGREQRSRRQPSSRPIRG
jgi:hypothetical protein